MGSASARVAIVPIVTIVIVGLVLALGVPPAGGQALPVDQDVDHLPFNRPESWAMKYYTAIALPTGMGVPQEVEPGALRLGLEAGWIPTLRPEQRRVGFNGTKKEDLNKLPVLGRLRLAVGLPWQLTLDATWAPPIELNGVTSHPVSLGIGRPLLTRRGFTLGLRGYGGRHWSQGSFTCSAAAEPAIATTLRASAAPDEHEHAADMSDCQAPSKDTLIADYAGLELGGSYRFVRARGLETYLTASATYMLLEFQIGADLMTHLDRTRLETRGAVYLFASGLRYPITPDLWVAGEAFYAPLTVKRPPDTDTQIDPLFNLRGLLEYRF